MTIPVSTILTRVQNVLLDPSNVEWSQSELIDYINAAVRAVIMAKPNAHITDTSFTLTAGSVTQTIPSDGYLFLELKRNINTAPAIRMIDRDILDRIDPNWQSTTGTAVLYYMADPRNPTVFEVYPHPDVTDTSHTVRLVYASEPASVTLSTDTIALDIIYEAPLVEYVLYLAYAKNSKRGDVTKASFHNNNFRVYMGLKQSIDPSYAPRILPPNANVPPPPTQ